MLKQLLVVATLFTSVAQAQTIKNKAGRVLATNEVTTTLTADPETLQPGSRTGFKIDFDMTYGWSAIDKTYFLIQVNAIKPYLEKGYYRELAYNKPGKYYSCAQLDGQCNNLEVSSIWVLPTWSFNGQEFKGGNTQLSSQNGNFVNYYTNLNPPASISYADVKSGAARITKVEIVSWTVKNEDAIITTIRKIQDAKK